MEYGAPPENEVVISRLLVVIAAIVVIVGLAVGIVMLSERAAAPTATLGKAGTSEVRTGEHTSSPGVAESSSVQAKREEAISEIKKLKIGLDRYFLDNGQYPTAAQGLQALVTKPMSGPIPPNYRKGGYLKHIPLDPWGHPYFYKRKREGCMLKCLGADGKLGGTGANADIDASQVHISGKAVLGQ